MILFGVSNMLSDVYECINLMGKKVTRIVINVREETRERTKDFETRLQELYERPLITPLDNFTPEEGEEYFVVPVTPRKHLLIEYLKNTYQLQFSHLIHPAAYVSPFAKIGQGVFIGAKSIISTGCILKDHVFVGHGVTVGHDAILHDYVRLNPGSNIAGHVEIFDNVLIGLGANVIEELVIGKDAVVAAGAVVIRDVKENTLVAGVPAIVRKVYDRRASDVDGQVKKSPERPSWNRISL
jgi:sugar O-acyltransferase (sialic acid O-acetyltransferase NeuD family)